MYLYVRWRLDRLQRKGHENQSSDLLAQLRCGLFKLHTGRVISRSKWKLMGAHTGKAKS